MIDKSTGLARPRNSRERPFARRTAVAPATSLRFPIPKNGGLGYAGEDGAAEASLAVGLSDMHDTFRRL